MSHRGKMKLIGAWSLIMMCLLSATLWGQGMDNADYGYEFQTVEVAKATKVGTFLDAAEDDEGFLWLSGTNGITAFDGRRYVDYLNKGEVHQLKKGTAHLYRGKMDRIPGRSVYCIQNIGESNILFFDTRSRKKLGTLAMPDNFGWVINQCVPLKNNQFLCLLYNADNTAYQVGVVQDGRLIRVLLRGRLSKDTYSILHCTGTDCWFSVRSEVYKINLQTDAVQSFHLPDQRRNVYRIFNDQERVYFTDYRMTSIYTLNPEGNRIVLFMNLPALMHDRPATCAVDNYNIYIGGDYHFILIDKNKKTVQDLSRSYTMAHDHSAVAGSNLSRILVSREGYVLLVTFERIYILKKKGPPLSLYQQQVNTVRQAFPALSCRGMTEGADQKLYLSYYTGIAVRDKSSKVFSVLKSISHIPNLDYGVYSLNCRGNTLFWNNLAIDLKTGRWEKIDRAVSNGGHVTQCLINDTLWLYSWWSNLLVRYDLKHGAKVFFEMGKLLDMPGAMVGEMGCIIPDQSGSGLWLALNEYGIINISAEGRLKRVFTAKDLGLDAGIEGNINVLRQTDDGLWYGSDYGLGILNPKTGTHHIYPMWWVDAHSVRHNRSIFAILENDTGDFYLSSSRGIVYFNTRTRAARYLPRHHPLASLEFNRNAAIRSTDGQYFFGSVAGLYAFYPDQLSFPLKKKRQRTIKINNVSFFRPASGKYWKTGVLEDQQEIVLQATDNHVNICYSLPSSYDDPVYYSYRVKDINEQWSDWQPNGDLMLMSLPPGKHILELKASTLMDYGQDAYSKTLVLSVQQIWYKRPYMILLLALGVIIVVLAASRYVIAQKQRRLRELDFFRTKVSADLHDDVGSVLAGLSMTSDLLRMTKDSGRQTNMLEDISKMSRQAMESMRDIVWAIDNRKDQLGNLLDRMRGTAIQMLGAAGMHYEWVVSDISEDSFIAPVKRQNIYMIYKEALSNIIRHSDGTHVTIKFIHSRQMLYLAIHDNGTFQPECTSDGAGLLNMKMRAEKIDGTFRLTYNQGYKVELAVPF